MKLSLLALLAAFAVSCDDGPTQTYNALPPGATAANGGTGAPYVDLIPKQSLGSGTGGRNALVRCTPEKRRKVWANELIKPMVPVRGAAGLDGTKDLTYTGLSIDEVEEALCQGNDGGVGDTTFGEQGELDVSWSPSTRLVTQFAMFTGYRGLMSFTDPQTMDKFSVSLESKPIDINGQPLRWNWRDDASNVENVTKIYNAMMRIYAPDQLPKQPVTDCRAVGGCVIAILGSGQTGAFAISPLGFMQFYFDLGVDDTAGKDILTRVYVPIQKHFDYSSLPFLARLPGTLEQDGAELFGKVGTKNCVAKPGIPFRAFIDNCIAVTGDAAKDAKETAKFLSGLRHSSESFFIDVVGVDPTFISERIRQSTSIATILDSDRPEDNDALQTLTVDQQLDGPIVNDYPNEDVNDPNGPDNHGSGLVNLTYAILVQQALDAADISNPPRVRHPVGDAACRLDAKGAPMTPGASGCTGMEGFLTTADPAAVSPTSTYANVALGTSALRFTSANGLAPANNQIASWSDNLGGAQPTAIRDARQKIWAGSAARVIKVLGQGRRFNVPSAFREPRQYATLWMQALTQYMIARGNVGKNLKLQDVLDAGPGGAAAHHIDPNYFFFDTSGGQQFDSAEYISVDFATTARPFYDMRIVVDATGGILNQLTFDAYPLRGERALLGAIASPGMPLGANGTLLQTNIFGSSVLSNGWKDPSNPVAPYLTAYDCASADTDALDSAGLTAFRAACGANNGPPVNAAGRVVRNAAGVPLLKPYKGGFRSTATIFNLGRNIGTIPTDTLQVMTRDVNLLQASLAFKTKVNPFDPSSADGPMLTLPMNYELPTDDTGIFIPINSTRDRFVKQEEFNTTGVAISTILGTVPVLKDGAVQPGVSRISSADSSDFLGEMFVCKSGGDLLSVRMFTPSEVVLDWILKHPAAATQCNLIIDYFEFGTVLSRVASLTNGVIVNFTRPAGITAQANNSAVSDVDIFAPGL